jgi:hypothetical protein
MAGKGSLKERGLRPLSNTLPLSNRLMNDFKPIEFERGIKGVSILPQPNANGT